VDFSHPPEVEAFRAQLREWLDRNLDDATRGAGAAIQGAGADLERRRAWNRRLADAGWAAISWPREHGGREASVIEQVVWAEEMHRAGAPPTLNPIGLSNIAPAIMEYGTEAQKRELLPRMLRGDDIWCQGFSEPDAGSDLASLRTSAVRDGDHWIVNGQKVWNTLGDVADWCELLVRTDPEAPKHRGISCLLVDMKLAGIEVRPIVTITGDTEFHEIFFRDVRVPANALLGPENRGWQVAMSTLNAERGGVASLHLGVRDRIAHWIEQARARAAERGAPIAPVLRRRLAWLYLEGEYLKLLSERALSGGLHGRPGPEGALIKIVWSEVSQRAAEIAQDVLGAEALCGDTGREVVSARSLTIAGGTTQVNKNIVAERVLGLPRRP
jgi:alkylation response protein AidB-like acyl-CoA dehydrogenase